MSNTKHNKVKDYTFILLAKGWVGGKGWGWLRRLFGFPYKNITIGIKIGQKCPSYNIFIEIEVSIAI